VVKLNGKLQVGIICAVIGILVLWVGGISSWGLCAVPGFVGAIFLALGFMEMDEESKTRGKKGKPGKR